MCASHRAVRGLIVELTGYRKHTVTDMEAGLEHLKRGTAKNVDMMLIVVEPYYRSLEAGMRTFKLATELKIPHLYAVSNKVRTEADREVRHLPEAAPGDRLLADHPGAGHHGRRAVPAEPGDAHDVEGHLGVRRGHAAEHLPGRICCQK